MVNTLTRQVGATFGPIVLETLVKHYFERLRKEVPDGKNTTRLRQDELLYDQAFNIVKVRGCVIGLYSQSLTVVLILEFSRSRFAVSLPNYQVAPPNCVSLVTL
jgi:hypothetical protein